MNIFIYGAGGHAKVAIDILELTGYSIVGLIEYPENKGKEVMGYTILGGPDVIDSLDTKLAFVAVGNNPARVKIANQLLDKGITLVNAIHPTSLISKHAKIGNGVMVGARATVNAGATICDHAIINTNALVEHDDYISEGAHICPSVNLAGTVNIGKYSMIGIGTSVIQNITIGDNTTIGASSVVVRDIPSDSTALGAPCKVIIGK